jgi:hypothetical protein
MIIKLEIKDANIFPRHKRRGASYFQIFVEKFAKNLSK